MKKSNPSRRDLLRIGGALAAWTTLPGGAPSQAAGIAPKDITAEEVARAIDRAKGFLLQQQREDGVWPNRPNYDDGLTPLCTLALLTAGCDRDEEAVQKALAYLRGYRPISTYTASLQTMVFCMADADEYRNLITRNVLWLESRQVQEGPETGMWAIPSPGSTDHIDNSMTHFAMLALYEAECAGVLVRQRTWRMALDYWREFQNRNGSWGWSHGYDGTGSMTCAGVAAVIIASGVLGEQDTRVEGERIVCADKQHESPQLEKAITWLSRHFSISSNPGFRFWESYYLYSLERMGRLTAQRFVGQHDWYREGARMLVDRQLHSGAWPSDTQFDKKEDPNVSTSFSLMFLAKGRRPILFAHLKHEPLDDWNRHRNAMFNLTSYVEQAWGMPLAYQVVDIQRASVEDLLESPVIYINGRETPQFSDEEIGKLRMYVDRGGFIFAEQCCGLSGFDRGLRRVIKKMFPETEMALQLLPHEHPAWHAEEQIDLRYLRELWGIDVGCRTGVVYCPQRLSCYWELGRLGRESQYPQSIQEQIAAARGVGQNILAYATNRELKFKNPASRPAAKKHEFRRGAVYVADVLHTGVCKTAPAALRNLLHFYAEQFKTLPVVEPGEVRLGNEALFEYHLVFFHGRRNFQLTPTERDQLREYLTRGGMMFADAVCSSELFNESFRREMATIFPEYSLERIPLDHPLITGVLGGAPISTVSLRQLEKTQSGHPRHTRTRTVEPHLQGIKIEDRYVVIFSPYDVSCALDGHATPGCDGYLPADAMRIAVNVLLYSCH